VVAAESDDAREGFPAKGPAGGGTGLVGVGGGGTGENVKVAFFNLAERKGVVVGSYGDVTAIEDGGPAVERVGLERDVVSAVKVETARTLTDTGGTEASTGAVGSARVEGRADEGDVVAGIRVFQAVLVGETAEGGDAREHRVGLSASITGESVVPERLVGTRHGLLGVAIVGNGNPDGHCPAEAEKS